MNFVIITAKDLIEDLRAKNLQALELYPMSRQFNITFYSNYPQNAQKSNWI